MRTGNFVTDALDLVEQRTPTMGLVGKMLLFKLIRFSMFGPKGLLIPTPPTPPTASV